MSRERIAEILELPSHEESDQVQARRMVQGRNAIDRYSERLTNAAQHLKHGPEAAEIYCSLAELRDGLIDNNLTQSHALYTKALEAFSLSRPANLGIRRIACIKRDLETALASFERDLTNASSQRMKQLKTEMARVLLVLGNDAIRARKIIDDLDALDSPPPADPDSYTADSEISQAERKDFDVERFFLKEDILWAQGDWGAYESMLREALSLQDGVSDLTTLIETRLFFLYRYILPDQAQASLLLEHLAKHEKLDPELIDYLIEKAETTGNRDAVVETLSNALESSECGDFESLYRLNLANTAHFLYEDLEHAADVLKIGIKQQNQDPLLIKKLLSLQEERGDKEALLEALTHNLDYVENAEQRAETLYDIATILRDELEQDEAANDLFEEAISICPTHQPTISVLEELYRNNEQWDDIAELYEQELHEAKLKNIPDYSVELCIEKLLSLADIYENNLAYHLKAFGAYQQILNYKADDITALKGAARMSDSLGNWTELLQLYAKAESTTQDEREHVYLLERIADIAENYLNDADTACTALEALRVIEPKRQSAISQLARLYIRLDKFEALIKLNDEECEFSSSNVYKATLLCKNGDIALNKLSNIMLATQYYEKAKACDPRARRAVNALESCLEKIEDWEKLAKLLSDDIEQIADPSLKCRQLHKLAKIQYFELDECERAINSYEKCLRYKPRDTIAQKALINHFNSNAKWHDLIRIYQIQAENLNPSNNPSKFYFEIGQIYQFRILDEQKACDAYERASASSPNNLIYLHAWLEHARKQNSPEQNKSFLIKILQECSDDTVKARIYTALADQELKNFNDDNLSLQKAAAFLEKASENSDFRRIYPSLLAPALAQEGRWTERLKLALAPSQIEQQQKHALLGSVILNFPPELRQRSHEILCELQSTEDAQKIWARLSPAQRPKIDHIEPQILAGTSHDAQDLRRWFCIERLLQGDTSDPTQNLLPDDRDENLSYRPDLELLAAYFETFEKWLKLLEVLSVQEENTRNEQEKIQVILQRAWILSKIRKHDEALKSVQDACRACSYSNPLRMSLYDYLKEQKDWNFLVEQMRQHLMNTDDPELKSQLWMRLAEIYDIGLENQDESLRCLDQAYREYPSDGQILTEIAELASRIGEISIARRALDDYLQFHEPSIDEQIKLAPKILELHFKHEGGNKEEILKYFENLAQLSAQARQSLEVLAQVHAIAGDPAKSAEILLRLVRVPFIIEDLPHWLLLCELYVNKLDQAAKAEELLWSLFANFPEKVEIFNKLDATYTSREERRIFVENIKTHVNDGEVFKQKPDLARQYLGFAAQILGSELGIWKEAQDLYSEAIDKAEIPQPELVKNRAYARCRVPGEAGSAYEEFCQLLVTNPFDEDIFRAAIEICRRNEALDRERILQQIAKTFIPERGIHLENQPVRPKVDINRPLNQELLKQSLSDPALRTVQNLLHEAIPLLDSLFKDKLPKRSLLGGSRERGAEIQNLFSATSTSLNLGAVKLYLAPDPSPTPLVFDDPHAVWLPTDNWESLSKAEQRHWSAYASGLLWTGLSKLIHYDMLEVWHTLDAAYYLSTNECIEHKTALTLDFAEKIKSPWLRRERREIAKIIDEIGKENIPLESAKAWKTAIFATADRAGLLFSGDVAESIPAIIAAEGWSKERTDRKTLSARLEQSPRIQALIRFALSNDYLQLRYHAGLAARPSEISG